MGLHIYLVCLGQVDRSILALSEKCIQRHFPFPTKISPRRIELQPAYDSVRHQYNSSKLLREIIQDPPADALKVFGLTEVDLFLPIFTFLFGEAQLNGLGGLLSVHRLHNRFYGLPEDPNLLQQRVRKEIIHELGHNFGLVHCFDPVCVMRPSTYVEEIDQKEEEFCAGCAGKVTAKIKPLR